MFGLFKKSPLKKLEAEHKALLTKGFHARRNGDVRTYAFLTAEAEAIRETIDALKAEEDNYGLERPAPPLTQPLPRLETDPEASPRTDDR